LGHDETARGSAGEVAALVVGLAADLATHAARSSTNWSERGGALAQADAIRARALELATEIEEAYGAALSALTRALGASGRAPEASEVELGDALRRVIEPLLGLAEQAGDVAELAELVARSSDAPARADAVAATMLATAAADVCAHLVEVNLLVGPDDERSGLARELLASAVRSRDAALAASR
jgi:formiminotetrahydrofolate cyclodeaminase